MTENARALICTVVAAVLLAAAATAVLAISATPALAQAPSGKAPKGPALSKAVLKPLKAANDLATENKLAEAEARLNEADAVAGKTPFDQYQIDEVFAFVYLKQKRYGDALKRYESALQSGLLDPARVPERLKLISQLSFQVEPRDLAKAIDFGVRYLDQTGRKDAGMLGLIGQGYYLREDLPNASKLMQEAIGVAESSGVAVEENWLLILQVAAAKLKDAATTTAATIKLARLFPRKEHWLTLTTNLLRQPGNKDRTQLNIFRFMQAAGVLDAADDITEAADVAIRTGSPGEALKFLEDGYASKVLETSGNKVRSQQLLAEARRLTDIDRKGLVQFEKEARNAKVGETDIRLGEAFLSYDQPEKALEAIQRGLGKGGVKNPAEANLLLGRTYLKQNNPAEAQKAFEQAKTGEYTQLAELWSILAGQS